jgi:hypothetical protein
MVMGRAVMVAALVAVGVGVVPGEASAAGLRCGDRVVADTVLTRDLRCASGPGLVLEGGVTLDLGGHRIVGPGAEAEAGDGVLVSGGVQATVRNGAVVGWPRGVAVEQGDDPDTLARAAVDGISFRGNGTAVWSFLGEVRVAGSVFRDNGSGVNLFFAGGSVERSTFRGNRAAAVASQVGPLRVTDSTFVDNESGVDCTDVGCAVERSRFTRGTAALTSYRASVALVDSEVRGHQVGFRAQFEGGGDSATNSRFVGNDVAVRLSILGRVTLTGNRFTGNRVGVTETEEVETAEATLTGNRFDRNGDAVLLTVVPARLGTNVATRNTGWGLYAPHAVDLGGNRARGNGNQPQCVGVAC